MEDEKELEPCGELENTGENTARKGPIKDPVTGKVSGGNPGNAGGSGRPRNKIRDDFAKSLDQRRKIMEKIIDNDAEDGNVRISAFNALGRYSGLQQTDVTSGDQPMKVRVLPEDVQL